MAKLKNPLSGITESVINVEKHYVNNDEFRNGFVMIGKGIGILGRESGLSVWKVCKETGLAFHRSFTHYPYPWTFLWLLGFGIYHVLSIADCRIERDQYAVHNYRLEKKIDSLSVITSIYASYNKTLSERVDSFVKNKSVEGVRRLNSSTVSSRIMNDVANKEVVKEDIVEEVANEKKVE